MRSAVLCLLLALLCHHTAFSQAKESHYSGQMYRPEMFEGRWIGVSTDGDSPAIKRLAIGTGSDSVPIQVNDNVVALNHEGVEFQLFWDENILYGLSDQNQFWKFYRDTIDEFDSGIYYLDTIQERYGYVQYSGNESTPSLLFNGDKIIPFDMIQEKVALSFDGALLYFVDDDQGKRLQIQKEKHQEVIATYNLLPAYTSVSLMSADIPATLFILDEQIQNSVIIFDPSVLSLPEEVQTLLHSLAAYRYVNYIWPDESANEAWVESVSDYYANTIWGTDENQILIRSGLNISPELASRFTGIADVDPAPDEFPPYTGTTMLTVELGEKEEQLLGKQWNRIVIAESDLFFLSSEEKIDGTTSSIQPLNWTAFGSLYQWSRAADPQSDDSEEEDESKPTAQDLLESERDSRR